ncbi:MAG: serine/threonine protein kinase [Deltaproteobacteria bacterium]|nr:serine/threonine protein kinase [Deltaproteobacteria bacterium]
MPATADRPSQSGRTLTEVRQRRSSVFEPRPTVVDAPRIEDRPTAGTVLDGRYEVGELLGQGGMGYVLAATHTVLGKRLAVKVLKREMTRDPEMAELFREEARAASSIGHPNIVEVSDFGTLPSIDGSPGASYFVMERLEGVCLADLISHGPMEVRRAVEIVRQMASALHAAHERGIVHRDVKPENVILTTRAGRADHVKILDFGLAKLGHDDLRVIGTPEYMSPEQGRARGVDRRSDVYSLGIVLYELLTGTVPFLDRDPLLLLRKHALEAPPSVKSLRADLPDDVVRAIERAIEKRASDRPQTMEDFILLLASIEAPTPTMQARRSQPVVAIGLVDAGPQALDPKKPRPSFSVPSTRPTTPTTQAPSSSGWLVPVAVLVVAACVTIAGIVIFGARSEPAAPSAASNTAPLDGAAILTAPAAPELAGPAVIATTPSSSVTPTRDEHSHGGSGERVHSVVTPTSSSDPGMGAGEVQRPTDMQGLYYADQNLLDPWEH